MKKNLNLFIILLLLSVCPVRSQEVLTLKECYDRAMTINSLSRERDIYNSIWQLKDENLEKNWLPTLDANGSFIYNSSVIDLSSTLGSLPLPGITDALKPLPNEQYKITLDVNQVIFDGGLTRKTRDLQKADLSVNEKQTEADQYQLRGQINNYYFNLILIDHHKQLLNNFLETINSKISAMQSAVKNGIITKSDLDVMMSEKIKMEQQLDENEIRRNSLLKNLSDLTGLNLDKEIIILLPVIKEDMPADLLRPELQLFDLRKDQLSASINVAESRRLPKAYGFATLGYGNPPGSNFFRDEFASFYILGAGIKWNIFDWNKTRNEKRMFSLQQEILDGRKSDFADNINRLLESKNAEISSLAKMIESDSVLIALRKRITVSAESQYDNGTITASDYMKEMNSEKEALINFEIHKINLVKARVEYLNISGQEIEK
jgi:outer membrane protein TolC